MNAEARPRRGHPDVNQLAAAIVAEATAPPDPIPADSDDPTDDDPDATDTDGKNPAAVALGRLGGQKGGPARAAKLSASRRREIAKKAARARWDKQSSPSAIPRHTGSRDMVVVVVEDLIATIERRREAYDAAADAAVSAIRQQFAAGRRPKTIPQT